MRRTTLALSVAAALAACGGSGGGDSRNEPSNPAQISGRVIDGYVRGAVVFWDCNRDGVQDSDEVSTVTSAQGAYKIEDLSVKGCPLLAYVGPTAIDEDRPLQLGSAYTMQAAPGKHDLITPFSTLVSGRVSTNGVSVDQAKSDVADIFGVEEDILIDYRSTKSAPLSSAAIEVAAVLQTSQQKSIFSKSTVEAFESLKQRYENSDLKAAVAIGITAFSGSFRSLTEKVLSGTEANGANRLVRRVTFAEVSNNASLESISSAINAKSGTKHGYPNWNAFSTDELKSYARTIGRLNSLQSDSVNAAKLEIIQRRRSDLFSEASIRLNKEVGYDGALVGTWNFFATDPGASLDYAIEAISISGDIATDVVTLAMPRPKLGRPTNLNQYKKKLAAQLEIYSYMVAASDCLIKLNALDGAEDPSSAIVDTVTACGAFFAENLRDVTATIKTGKVTQGLAAALDASGGIYGVVREEDRQLVALKLYATTFGLMHDLFDLFAKDPVTSKLNSMIDLAIQYLNARVAAMELEKAANQKLDDKLKTAIENYDAEVSKAWRSYFISFMETFGDYYFRVVDSSTCVGGTVLNVVGQCVLPASVGSFTVLPARPKIGETITLKAVGAGLIDAGYRFSNFTPCVTDGSVVPTVLTDVLMTYQCVAKMATFVSYVGVLDGSGTPLPGVGQELRVYCADGSEPVAGICAVSAAIELPGTIFVRGENVALSANGYGADTLMNAPPYLSAANAAEWDFTVATAGTYELFAEYAAELSRPVVISFNGAVKFNSALSVATGGWFPANRQVISQGTVQLTAGSTTMRVSRGDVFPHIKGFRLVPTAAVVDGLVGHWSFDGCDGRDASVNANHGTVFGAPA